MNNVSTYFFPSIAKLKCTPSDTLMYPQGYMCPSLGTLFKGFEQLSSSVGWRVMTCRTCPNRATKGLKRWNAVDYVYSEYMCKFCFKHAESLSVLNNFLTLSFTNTCSKNYLNRVAKNMLLCLTQTIEAFLK